MSSWLFIATNYDCEFTPNWVGWTLEAMSRLCSVVHAYRGNLGPNIHLVAAACFGCRYLLSAVSQVRRVTHTASFDIFAEPFGYVTIP